MKRIVALDVGDVRIGIAVSDPTRTIAQPVETYTRIGWGPDCRYIRALCDRYETDELLLGLPLNMDGSAGFQSEKVRAFAEKLEQQGLNLHWQDERMTTVTADDVLIQGGVRREDRKKYVDKIAATVILEEWLADQSRREGKNMENENLNNNEEMMDEDEEIITLQDEDGNDVNFAHRMTVEVDGNYYVVLDAIEDGDEAMEGESIILRIEQDDNEEDYYVTIEDEDELDRVVERITEILDEEEAEYGTYEEEDRN